MFNSILNHEITGRNSEKHAKQPTENEKNTKYRNIRYERRFAPFPPAITPLVVTFLEIARISRKKS